MELPALPPGPVGGIASVSIPTTLPTRPTCWATHPEVILAGRRINDSMGKYVAEQTVKQMIQAGSSIMGAKVTSLLGLTFSENCPDLRKQSGSST